MSQKLNDIYEDLEKKINMRHIFSLSRVKTLFTLKEKNTKDIHNKWKKRIDISKSPYVKIIKNTTKNFDALRKKGLKNNIVLAKKKYDFRNKIFFYYWEKFLKNMRKKLSDIYHNPRSLLPFFIFLLLFYFSFWYFIIQNRVNAWFQKIISLKDSPFRIDNLQKVASSSARDFQIAYFFFFPYFLIPSEQVDNAEHIINWGLGITKTMKDFYRLYQSSEKFINKKWIKEIMFSQLLENIHPSFSKIIQDWERVLKQFEEVKNLSNKDIQKKIEEQVKNLTIVMQIAKKFDSNYMTFLDILGHSQERNYLIIFQNSDEIRPTWWFMGSMGIASLFRGKLKSFEKNDVYAYEWNLKRQYLEKEIAPEWIDKITETFGLRDSNYFIDTKESAEKIKFFMEKWGYKIDGIVFLNQNIVLEFLDTIKWVDYKNLWEKITSDNFSEIMSLLVESKVRKEWNLGSPKQALFDFIDDFSKKLVEEKKYKDYLSIIGKNIKKRELIFYSFHQKENDFLHLFELDGNITYPTSLDFAYPIFTSISGNKSDRYIKRNFEKEIKINENCSIDTKMTIIQRHSFTKGNEDFLKYVMNKYEIQNQDYLLWIQGKWPNYQYIRVVLPWNSIIKEKKDINISEQQGKKIVSFYTQTQVWEETSFDIDYSLQNTECKNYDFIFLKQAGIKEYDIKIHTNKGWIEKKGVKEDFVYEGKNLK